MNQKQADRRAAALDLGPRSRDKVRRKESIVLAALSVFANRGYETATTREIARRAGCSEALVYRYFKGKSGLLATIVAARIDELRAEVNAASSDEDTFEELIRERLLSLISGDSRLRQSRKVGVSAMITDAELGRTFGKAMHEASIAIYLERLRRHQEGGSVPAGANLTAIAHAISALNFYLGFMLQDVWEIDRTEVKNIALECVRIISSGVATLDESGALSAAANPFVVTHSSGSQPAKPLVSRNEPTIDPALYDGAAGPRR